MVAILSPARDHGARFGKAGEHFIVPTLVPGASVEALNEAVLGQLAGYDVVSFDARAVGPFQHRPQLSASATKSSNQRWLGPCGIVSGGTIIHCGPGERVRLRSLLPQGDRVFQFSQGFR